MSYKEILDSISDNIERTVIEEVSDAIEIITPDYGWKNKRYISDSFRVLHIERYSERTLEVLHITCFPHIFCGNPIFGFDVITTDRKPLAAFLDWSPIDNDVTFRPSFQFKDVDYPLPDWAKSIFSRNAIAIVPRGTFDMELLSDIVLDSFKDYLSFLSPQYINTERVHEIIKKQNLYCEQQQKNERTFNVLKAKLGDEKAREFMETILFPKVISH